MKMEKSDNLDLLILKATETLVEEETAAFCSVPEGGEIPAEAVNRFHKIKKKNQKRTVHPKNKKLILIAALIAIVLVLSACAGIPAIREKIKKLIVSTHDKFFSVAFNARENSQTNNIEDQLSYATSTTESASTETDAPSVVTKDPPKTILQKAYASYLPENYIPRVSIDLKREYQVEYVSSSDQIRFSLTQRTINSGDTWIDNESNVQKVSINGDIGIIVTETTGGEPHFTLVWQTNEYLFCLDGFFKDIDSLISVAEGVRLSMD